MNPPMTPLDKTLVDQMHAKLAINPHVEHKNASMYLSGTLFVETIGAGRIRFIESITGSVVILDGDQVQHFEDFLVQIGWRCS